MIFGTCPRHESELLSGEMTRRVNLPGESFLLTMSASMPQAPLRIALQLNSKCLLSVNTDHRINKLLQNALIVTKLGRLYFCSK
jgi:hypothetical protein